MRYSDDRGYLAQLQKPAQWNLRECWCRYQGFRELLHFLAFVFAGAMVPCSQSAPSVHRQGYLLAHRGNRLLCMGYFPGPRYWPRHPST